MRRVLVPTDFSEAGLLVTEEVASWVEAMGGEVLLLHVVPDMYLRWLDDLAITFIDQTRLEAAYEELREEGQRQFSAWLPYPTPERWHRLVVVGDTADVILTVAQEERVDAIIMRAPTRRWWRPALAGSVTGTILRKAPLPVIVWAGVDSMSVSRWWQGAPPPHAQEATQGGIRRARKRAQVERTSV